ncbi:MAG: laminin G domain-containing protein [Actinomycetota bacterium]
MRLRAKPWRMTISVVAGATWLVVAAASLAGATASNTLAYWQMNERSGAGTMVDSSGHHIDGSIGNDVIVGATYDGATGYRWAFTSPTNPPAKPERLVLVYDSRLNPGSGDFAVTLRYRTIQPFGNIIQKGQGGADGGYWKIENPRGILTCVFRGRDSNGNWQRKEVTSGTPLNDGQWHTVRCERTSSALTLTVDSRFTRTSSGRTGNISNPRPISIAGKSNCDQTHISCDYFTGDIDWVKIETG